ncbi:MAG: ABC transporter ATP-binding protein [Lachnospiraceae bacterium]|nr:ABC transporter ATP-binding protein [Lachnospiraceae bacterium]
MSEQYAIECRGITKIFGGKVTANDHVDLQLKFGEILALLGENGSGKTTLMNMLSGIYRPDGGTIYVRGEEVFINSPVDAMNLGIGMIHQHFKLVNVFSAMDNIAIGTKGRRLSVVKMREKIREISSRFGLEVDPDKKIYDMSVSEKQTVEILKVLYRGSDILILDEPTAVLTPQETEKLFAILKKMRDEGKAIIIITHKLNEVMEISDRVSVLRKGKSVASVNTAETDELKLTELMVGHSVDLSIRRPETDKKDGVLKVSGLSVTGAEGMKMLKDVSFEVKGGEILGVAGVAGSGQKELCEAITGLIPFEQGSVRLEDTELKGKSPFEILNLGVSISFVPEDRLGMGLVSSMGITDNMLLRTYYKTPGLFIDRKPAKEMADKLIDRLQILTPGTETPVRLLSGGNVQKVLLGREIESAPRVLITAYAVRGLDINSSYAIYDLLNEQKEKGVAVLNIGEDLDVLLALCDRILVLCHGEVTGIVDAKNTTKEQLGLLMTGIKQEKEAAHV